MPVGKKKIVFVGAQRLNFVGGFQVQKDFAIRFGQLPFLNGAANNFFGARAHVRVDKNRRERLNKIRNVFAVVFGVGDFERDFR